MAVKYFICALLVASCSAQVVPKDALVHHGVPVENPQPVQHGDVHRAFPMGSMSSISVQDVRVTPCGPNNLIKINQISMTPDMKLTVNVSVKANLQSDSPISMDMDVQKKFPFVGWHSIHSHHVDDVCSLARKFEDKCTSSAILKENNIPCTCPMPQGEYSVKDLDIKAMATEARQQRSFGSLLAGGSYSSKVIMKQDGKVLACSVLSLKMSM